MNTLKVWDKVKYKDKYTNKENKWKLFIIMFIYKDTKKVMIKQMSKNLLDQWNRIEEIKKLNN